MKSQIIMKNSTLALFFKSQYETMFKCSFEIKKELLHSLECVLSSGGAVELQWSSLNS